MIFALALLSCFAFLGWYVENRTSLREKRARHQAEAALQASVERLHVMANSGMCGAPLVKWTHPNPCAASDKWYYRVRIDSVNHLFTEEAVGVARQRAHLLLPTNHK